MLLSFAIQVISFCRSLHADKKIISWIKSARTLPRWRTIRLRRKVDLLWGDFCGDDPESYKRNAFFDALLDLGENASDAEVEEIMRLAAEYTNT
jgi:hypothetical protein